MKKILSLVIVLIVVAVGTSVYLNERSLSKHSNPAATSHSTAKQPANTKSVSSDGFNKQAYSLNDPTSLWVVVNKLRPLNPINYAPTDLTAVGNGQYMRAQAASALSSMLAGAKAAGYIVSPESGYRSYSDQQSVYASEVKAYGQAYADTESARPGYSEHQSGWAIDLGSDGCNIEDCFGNTPGGKWIITNAYQYGFILRYAQGKSAITGYRYESWHFRYVGTALAGEMHKQNILTLEEFFGLSAAPNYQ